MNPIMWQPDQQRIENSRMREFMRRLEEHGEPRFEDYAALHRWSIDNPARFWQEMADFGSVRFRRPARRIHATARHIREERWFEGAGLNFAENLLRHRDERPALMFYDESGHRETLNYADLYRQVNRLACWLYDQGVRPGDRIAAVSANRTETVVAMLATAALGAVWSSCSADFGVRGILDRFRQIQPRVLFAVSSHCYAGRVHHHDKTLEALLHKLPGLEQLVVFPELYGEQPELPEASETCRVSHWDEAMHGSYSSQLAYADRDFDDPLCILYSSGTTGMPKCIVHSVGGTLLQHRKEHMLHVDLRREDVLFYFTTCGWMMWNWLVSALAEGSTLVLYDGSPFHPRPEHLFDLIDEAGITVFGVSAKFFSAAAREKLRPRETHSLASLKTILSTGSPLTGEGFDYVYRDVHPDVALQSISGGTDIISCFVLGCPLLPVRREEIQCAGLGMDVAVFDEHGQAVIGQKGELVCRRAFPSMPVGFWHDPGDEKYREAYFRRFTGVWTHGDYAEQTPEGGFIIHGRSDTMLNPGGVRIGTAEIYRQLDPFPEVVEALAVDQQWQDDTRIVLFVQLEAGIELDEDLEQRLRAAIREGASPRHVPARLMQVDDIPRTLNGKLAEVAVRNIINGDEVDNEQALANPGCLAQYHRLAQELTRTP